jgi:leucine dehydrogenase
MSVLTLSTFSRGHAMDVGEPEPQVPEPQVPEPQVPEPQVLVPGTDAPLGETLVLCRDRSTGLIAAIAVDDTTLGPGLGGVRWMPYPSLGAAAEEATRLARVMTLKNALAEIPYGGAKSVIVRQRSAADQPGPRRAQLLAFAATLRHLEGAYVPGVDMGTSVADLAVLATVVPWVSCNHEDPSPATALGVFHSIDAAVRHTLRRDLSAVRVTVQGAGHVGSTLADLLATAGARVTVADTDRDRAAAVARRVNGVVVAPEAAHAIPCDVFAPCATARVLHAAAVDELDCAVVAGAANDVLAERSCAELVARRGIVYVPDFVANAGGVVQIHAERARWEASRLAVALAAVGQRTSELLDEAAATRTLPLHVAERRASARLGHAITIPD